MRKNPMLTNDDLKAEQQRKVRAKQTRLDKTRLALAYARQSTKDQPIKNVEAAGMQTEELVNYAVTDYQWPEARVLLFVENYFDQYGNKLDKPRAASGRLDTNHRAGLREVENYIAGDKAGAVFVRDISRLFRDEDMIDPRASRNSVKTMMWWLSPMTRSLILTQRQGKT